jgi:hypothetical protein
MQGLFGLFEGLRDHRNLSRRDGGVPVLGIGTLVELSPYSRRILAVFSLTLKSGEIRCALWEEPQIREFTDRQQ